jgi:hypothetical protein
MRVPMQPEEFMDEDREEKMVGIKEQIERGNYRVDPAAVADAILRRMRGLEHPGGRPRGAQNRCSYPDSCSSSPSTKLTPRAPGTTDPIQVRPNFPPSMYAITPGPSAAAGMHTHSS